MFNVHCKGGKLMAKANRGRNLRNSKEWNRGTCPVCERTGVKLLYTNTNDNDEEIKVCKQCKGK